MVKIYRDAFRFFFASLPALLAFAALIEITLWFLRPKHESSITFVSLIILAYIFHRHFLFGEPFSFFGNKAAADAPPFRLGWFLLFSAALVLAPVVISFVLALAGLGLLLPGSFLLLILPLYLLLLSLFGTGLPAIVARDENYDPSEGLRLTLSTMWRLILGPGLVGLAGMAAALLADHGLSLLGLGERHLAYLAANIAMRTIGFLNTIMAVAVLCEMYRRCRPDSEPSPEPATGESGPA